VDNKAAYNLVASSEQLNSRLTRGQNAVIELYGEEYGKKWVSKTPRPGENDHLHSNELNILRRLQDTGVVPELHEDYLDDSWGECSEIVMLLLNNAASLGDYAEAALAGEIPMGIFRAIVVEAKKSLEVFHGTEVIHNDLHANNLVVTIDLKGNWKVYVIDFGWSYQGEVPDWMEYERTWIAEDEIEDLQYLKKDLGNRCPDEDEEYFDILNLLV